MAVAVLECPRASTRSYLLRQAAYRALNFLHWLEVRSAGAEAKMKETREATNAALEKLGESVNRDA